MKRRNVLAGALAALLSPLVVKGKVEAKSLKETRTHEYIEQIPIWDEHAALDEMAQQGENSRLEYLFTLGYDKKSYLDAVEDSIGYAFVYTPRHGMHDGRLFDLILVKIGDRNISGRDRLHMEKT